MKILLGVVLIVCGILWYICKGELAARRETERKWQMESILVEAESVVMDFLDYGKEVARATKGKYRGTISVRVHKLYKSGEMGFFLSMYDSGDLTRLDERVLSQYQLEGFIKRYGYYYDPDRDAIVYQSSRGVKLRPEEKIELEHRLVQNIQNHPLAVIKSETVICTRGI